GHAGPPGNFSDPSSLRFDCDGNIAYGTAPGDVPGTSSSTDARLNWQHRLKRGVVTTSVYRQVQSGVVLPTQVNGTAVNGFPNGYLGAVQDAYDSPGGCNRPGAIFGAQNIYFSVPVGGVRRVYQGISVAATIAAGNFNFQPYYDITQAQIFSNDPRINNPYSIVSSGKQLPNTPLHKAGLTVDYKAPNSHVETLFTAQYVGANNAQNLPAYTLVDAGVEAQLERGSLVFAANNIFNTQSGIFATNAGAVPYTTANGKFIPTIARPNTPREFQVTYTVPFGSAATNAPARLLPAPRGPGRRFALAELPGAPPPDPFAMTTSDACPSKAQQDAAPIVAQLKRYVAKIEATKTAGGYPDAVPGAPDIAGVHVVYRKTGTSYALSLEGTGTAAKGFALAPACFAIHAAQGEDARNRGLFVPEATPFARPALQFMPAVGLYIVRATPQAGQQSFRLYRLPVQAPSAPFAAQSAPACTSAMRPVAQSLLGELQGYFVSGRPLKSWKVVAHSATGGAWYELTNDDAASLPALLNCGHISAASSAEIKAAGFDGVRPPTLNYAPNLGLYIVRGNQIDRGAGRPSAPSSPNP
ncbi:MAG: TonB-dependent receptor, partial [Candidatus Eremiobacteraeota bacterium]|nr:TonB-dependent receptor [Candidatus Eremiobacteraeota bacterium]